MIQPRNLIFLICLRVLSLSVMPFSTIAVFLRSNIFHLRFCVYNLLINLLWLLIRLTFGPGYLCNSRPLQDKSFFFWPLTSSHNQEEKGPEEAQAGSRYRESIFAWNFLHFTSTSFFFSFCLGFGFYRRLA